MASVEKIKSRKLRNDVSTRDLVKESKGEVQKSHKLKNSKIRVKNTGSSNIRKEEVFLEKGKKVRTRKLYLEQDEVEEKLDREIENEDNLSISLMFLILIGCFVVGIILGYMLYRLAIDSSAVVMIWKNLLF